MVLVRYIAKFWVCRSLVASLLLCCQWPRCMLLFTFACLCFQCNHTELLYFYMVCIARICESIYFWFRVAIGCWGLSMYRRTESNVRPPLWTLKNMFGGEVRRKSPLRSEILFASSEFMRRPWSDFPLHLEHIANLYTKTHNSVIRRLLPAAMPERWAQVCCIETTFGLLLNNWVVSTKPQLFPQKRIRWNALYSRFHSICAFVRTKPNPGLSALFKF